jgi:Na+/melibiose symporter-like transporter
VLDQPASAYSGIWLLFTLIPAIGYGLSLIAFAFYRLRDRDVQIMTEANVGNISREEALERLGERYS